MYPLDGHNTLNQFVCSLPACVGDTEQDLSASLSGGKENKGNEIKGSKQNTFSFWLSKGNTI